MNMNFKSRTALRTFTVVFVVTLLAIASASFFIHFYKNQTMTGGNVAQVPLSTNFYVDPDWTGVQVGTASQPWNALNAATWSSINAALASDDVTIYFSAIKADGVTQQTFAHFLQGRRTDYSPHRLTYDGYSFYNSNETTPAWLANPDADINHAYLNGKVCKVTGDGNQALGWFRVDGNSGVTLNGVTYACIESHLSSSDNQPGVGPNWRLYWDPTTPDHPVGSINPWASGTSYICYPKQNNVTIRGFEATGAGARTLLQGSNFIWEYNYIHDITGIGPGLTFDYTSHPDDLTAKIIAAPSTNIVFHHFKVARTYGEGFYIGSINPDAPVSFQVAHGNQHSHILIEDFVIDHPGSNGAQGDGIDCKHGVTYLTIRLGDISGFVNTGNGMNLPLTATNVDEHVLVERNFIHDGNPVQLNGALRGIHAQCGGADATGLYGIVGLTIRNNIVANNRLGIQVAGSSTPNQPISSIFVYNNTVYNCNSDGGIAVATNVTNSVVENNFVFASSDPGGLIGATGVVSDYNAHDGIWISNSEGSHTLTLTAPNALAAVVNAPGEDFHLVPGSPLIASALAQGSFSDDFAGDLRGPLWDISGYQYESTATPTPTATPTATATATATPTPTPTPKPHHTPSPH